MRTSHLRLTVIIAKIIYLYIKLKYFRKTKSGAYPLKNLPPVLHMGTFSFRPKILEIEKITLFPIGIFTVASLHSGASTLL